MWLAAGIEGPTHWVVGDRVWSSYVRWLIEDWPPTNIVQLYKSLKFMVHLFIPRVYHHIFIGFDIVVKF
jgi:hypothetical protein